MKVIFWNVDTQKDFMEKDGALYVEGAESIKPNLKVLTDFARENNITVINTADGHESWDDEISDNPDFINTFPKHCMVGTKGREFIEETYPKDYCQVISDEGGDPTINLGTKNFVLVKNVFDIFAGNRYAEKFLEVFNPDMVVVYGVATNVCVNYAVLGLADRGYNVIVVNDAIKELPNLDANNVLDNWYYEKGVKTANINLVLDTVKEKL